MSRAQRPLCTTPQRLKRQRSWRHLCLGSVLLLGVFGSVFGCVTVRLAQAAATTPATTPAITSTERGAEYAALKEKLVTRFAGRQPQRWGETVPGVKTRLAGEQRLLALTLDACGSRSQLGANNSVDRALVEFLEQQQVPATLFINMRWIEANRQMFERLAANPLFEIANHGLAHKPASVNGRAIYGITGTADVAELCDEIELAARRLEQLTGRRPAFYRSGTAYYDEVAVEVAAALGQHVAGFSLLGDCGATYSRAEVRNALLGATAGDIIIAHMNHPEAGSGAGIIDAVPRLRQKGFRFVRLSDYPLTE